MDQLFFFGDDVLQSLGINFDHLVDFREGAMEYMGEIKNGLMVEWYNEEEQEEKRQERLLDEHEQRLRRINGEFLIKFKERNVDFLQEAIKKLEEVNEIRRKKACDEENKRRVLECILVDLVRKIRNRRCPQKAMKIMTMLLERQRKREELHKELFTQFKKENSDSRREAIKKLEKVNEVRRRGAWDEENKRRMMESICVDLVRRIRKRRCPQTALKIMTKLIENDKKRKEMHGELLVKVTEREERFLVKKLIERELLEKVKSREKMKRVRARIQEEIMNKVREMKIRHQIKMYGYKDLMFEQIEKQEEINDFLPRKLFFFGIENFKFQAKPNCETNSMERVDKFKELERKVDSGRQYPSTAQKSKKKTTVKDRLKKFLRLK